VMKSKVAFILTIILALVSCLFVGCGVSQEEYDRVNAQFTASQSQAAELQRQINELKDRYEIVGETPAETAENIVKRYYETHLYSKYDFFVCSDMALDVWNMLKAHGINAVIQIGNVETPTDNITEADHAWVLAETTPGKYLALETTGGYAVWENDNYYRGWSFDNPKEYKRYVELKYEFNVRTDIAMGFVDRTNIAVDKYQNELSRYQELLDEFNIKYVGHPVSSESQNFRDRIETQLALVKVLEGKCSLLTELMNEQTKELENIGAEMRGLVQ